MTLFPMVLTYVSLVLWNKSNAPVFTLVTPWPFIQPQHLSQELIDQIVDYTRRIAVGLNVKGVLNIQYIVADGELNVIEVNPRSSRTVPFISKVTGINMVEYATRIALGESLKIWAYHSVLYLIKPYVAVKAPVFSFSKMGLVEIALGPEMKSTG